MNVDPNHLYPPAPPVVAEPSPKTLPARGRPRVHHEPTEVLAFNISKADKKRLRLLAVENDTTMSKLVLKMIHDYLDKNG